jgi:hypothetical protein
MRAGVPFDGTFDLVPKAVFNGRPRRTSSTCHPVLWLEWKLRTPFNTETPARYTDLHDGDHRLDSR